MSMDDITDRYVRIGWARGTATLCIPSHMNGRVEAVGKGWRCSLSWKEVRYMDVKAVEE